MKLQELRDPLLEAPPHAELWKSAFGNYCIVEDGRPPAGYRQYIGTVREVIERICYFYDWISGAAGPEDRRHRMHREKQ